MVVAGLPSLIHPPIAFGHRGARAHAPENTLESFRLALRLGATGLESVPEGYRGRARLVSGPREPAGPTRIAFTPGTAIRVSALIDGRAR